MPKLQRVDVTFPEGLFGRCSANDDDLTLKNPGSCVAGGGRTGYSVKIISRDALVNGDFILGGKSSSGGVVVLPQHPAVLCVTTFCTFPREFSSVWSEDFRAC